MPIYNLFSKRQKALRGEVNDILTYDIIPNKLRVQIFHIIKDVIGKDVSHYYVPSEAYESVYNLLCREYGRTRLLENDYYNYEEQVLKFLLQAEDVNEVIDVIEIIFVYIDFGLRDNFEFHQIKTRVKTTPDDAIEELNIRFKENGIGYAYQSGQIIKVDSTFIHSEITKPTLSLLQGEKFKGANEEYLKAHEHYRHGNNKACLVECLKAFESTLKIICNEKGWAYKKSDTSNKLIQVCLENGLLPKYIQQQFTSLQVLLDSGVSAIRNNSGGHGQGQTPIEVSDEITRYGLNLAGTNIVFLVEQSGIQ